MSAVAPHRSPTAVVTGGARGLGLAIARRLVVDGWHVVMGARDTAAAAPAAAALQRLGLGTVEVVHADLGTPRGAAGAAGAITDAVPSIDLLVHNAGIWPARRELTPEGLEQSFVTNHLAPFVLNHLLDPVLTAGEASVVQVTAGLYEKGHVDLACMPSGATFHPVRTYADTKLCNLMLVPLHAAAWAGTGIRINAVHPGVLRTGLGDRSGLLGLLLRGVKLTWKPAESGVDPVLRAAEAATTGAYYELYERTPLAAPADDPDLAALIWAQAAELTAPVLARSC